jgi:hypothetical protein
MTLSQIRSAADCFCFLKIANHVPQPLASECARLGFHDRHSATLAPDFEELRDKVFAWLDSQKEVAA